MKRLICMLTVLAMFLTFAPMSVFAEDIGASLVTEEKADVAEAEGAENVASAAEGTPTASVSEGTYESTQEVALSSSVEGAVIYYTTDGSEPTANSTQYTDEIRIIKTTTLKAIAVKDGETVGDVMTAVYTINGGYFKLLIGLLAGMLADNDDSDSELVVEDADLYVDGVEASCVEVGDIVTVVITPERADVEITWIVGGSIIDNTENTYTVTSLDMGKTIKAQVVGVDSYVGAASAVCTVAKTTTVAADDIMGNDADSSPVVLTNASDTKFLDDNGDEVEVSASSKLTLSIENSEKSEEEVTEATALIIEKIAADNEEVDEEDLEAALSDVAAVAVDVDLHINDTPVHPVGDVTVTLSAAQLGLEEGTDLTNYIFTANHTNKENESETVDGTVVIIDGVQYVRFELNGLSTIWIGNIPPRTVSFYNTEYDADNKVNSIGSVIVKFGDFTPTLQIPTPSRTGYLFCGWSYDMTRTPIITDLEVHALWVEGEKMPAANILAELSLETSAVVVEISDGLVSLDGKNGEVIPSDLTAEITVSAPSNAVKYYAGTDPAVVAAFNDAEGFIAISEAVIGFEIDVSGEDGLLIPSFTEYYYKWIDEAGEVIVVQSVEARVANGSDSADSKVYTVNVDRGIGAFEAYLIDSDDATKDYVAYINNWLNGNAIDGYTLRSTASFDGYRVDYDFSAYDTLKLVFTPFTGGAYDNTDTVAAAGEYYNGSEWVDNWTGTHKIEDGKLIVTYPFDVTNMSNSNADVTVSVNGMTQYIGISWYHRIDAFDEGSENIDCETWAEVLEAIKSVSEEKEYWIHCSDSSAITLSSSLTIPANVGIYLAEAPSFTVANGATLTLEENAVRECAAYLGLNDGAFIVENGGAVASTDVGDDNMGGWSTQIDAHNVTFKSGASLNVLEAAPLSINCSHSYNSVEDGVCTFEEGSTVNNQGNFNIHEFDIVNLNGTFNSTFYTYLYNDEINIGGTVNHTVNDWGYFEFYGTVNIETIGSIVINNTATYNYRSTNLEIYGPLTNRGTIELKGKTDAQIMNNGFVNYNMGTISVASDCSITTSGTKFINTGVMNGEGVINAYLGDDYTNYDDGVEYIEVENDEYWDSDLDKYVYTLSEYSRYKFTHDPAATVDVIMYLAEVVNMGEGQCTLTIDKEEFPQK